MRIVPYLAGLLVASQVCAQSTSLWSHISGTNGFGYRFIKSTSWSPANGGVLDLEKTTSGPLKYNAIVSVLPPSGTNYFNLSSYTAVSAEIKNTCSENLQISLAVVGDRQRGWDAVVTSKTTVPVGATQTFTCALRATYDDGTPIIDPNRVTSVQVIVDGYFNPTFTPANTLRVSNLLASGSASPWVYPTANGPRLELPVIENAAPAAGHRVRYRLPGASNVYSVLYLPSDWVSGGKYPVIVEIPGSIFYDGIYSDGLPDQCVIGYGMTKGQGAIWVSVPVVQPGPLDICENLWGDRLDAQPYLTVSNLMCTVSNICSNYGGDTNNLVLTGFSRGAIGCGYIGLHNPQIGSLWKGIHASQQYDGDDNVYYLSNTGYLQRASNFVGRAFFQTDQYTNYVKNGVTTYVLREHMVECMNVASNLRNAEITYVSSGLGKHACANFLDDRNSTKQLRSWFTNLTYTASASSNGTLNLDPSAYTVSEGNGTVSVTVKRAGGSSGAASVNYATSSETALAGSDYTAASGTLSWPAGNSDNKTISIPIINDTQAESSETFKITLSGAVGAALGAASQAQVTITDNDAVSQAVTVSTSEVWDGSANPHEADGVLVAGGGTEADPAVYTVPKGMTITATGKLMTDANRCIKMNIRGGDLNLAAGGKIDISWASRGLNSSSDRRVFILDLGGTNSITGAGTITSGITSGMDPVYRVHRALMITNANNVTLSDISLAVNYAATSYPQFQRPVFITASNTVTVTGRIENTDLQNLGDGASDVTVVAGAISVKDVDTGCMRTNAATPSASGGLNGNVVLKALKPLSYSENNALNTLSNKLTVTGVVRTVGVSGTGATQGNVTLCAVVAQFGAGMQQISRAGATTTFNVGVAKAGYPDSQLFINDNGYPVTPTYDVQWTAPSAPGTLMLLASSYTVSEGAGTVSVTVRRTGGSDGAASVQYATGSGSATSGSDFTAASGTLNWASGDSADKTVTLTIVNDSQVEASENLTFTLSNASGATLGSPSQAVVTLTDNDSALLPVTVSSTEVWDGVANPHAADGVTLTAGCGSEAAPAVYTIPSGMTVTSTGRITTDSTNSIRFVIQGGNLNLAAGGTIDISWPSRGINSTTDRRVFILDLGGTNSITGAGTITSGITNGMGPVARVHRALMITNANAVALSNISLLVNYAATPYPQYQRPVFITASNTVSVIGKVENMDLETGGNGGSDVTVLGGLLSLGGVDTRASRTNGTSYAGAIVLKALQAPGYDTNSVLNVLGNTITLSGAVRTDSGTYARTGGNITLQGVVAQFDSGSFLATRSGATTNLNVGVTKTGYSEGQLFVNNSGSAFAPTYSVQWTAPSAPGTLMLLASSYTVSEGTGTVSVPVRRTGGSDGAASVQYATGSGSATSGSDFTAASGTLSWASGDSADKTVTLTIINDSQVEASENLTFTLSNASGATLGSPSQAVVTLTDNDSALLPFTVSSTEVWDGVANPHAADGVTLTAGCGSEAAPAVYTIPSGMTVTSTGRITTDSTNSIRFVIQGGNLNLAAGGTVDISWPSRGINSTTDRRVFILDLGGTNSITGAGTITSGITNGMGPVARVHRALMITNANAVALSNISLHVNYAATPYPQYQRPVFITASNTVSVIGKVENMDLETGGNGGSDVTVLGGLLSLGGVDTRASRTNGTSYAGAIVLKALQAPGYDTNSVLNGLTNIIKLTGAVRTDGGTYSRTGGNITLQGVVAQFDSGSFLATRSGATTNLSVGVTKTGYSDSQLFINDSGSGYTPTYSVQWTAPANSAPHFTADPIVLPNAGRDVPYTATLAGTASDPDSGDTLSFSKVSGPSWLQIASGGALSGTPGVADLGSNEWQIAVSDGIGSGTACLKLVVVAPVVVSTSEAWDGEANPHGADGVLLDKGQGTESSPAIYTVPLGLTVTSTGKISCSTNSSDKSIRIRVRNGNLAMEAGSSIDVSRPTRYSTGTVSRVVFTLDLDGTNSITGSGLITSGITNATPTVNRCARAVFITNVNNVALGNISLLLNNGVANNQAFQRPLVITASGDVAVAGKVENMDLDTGGNGASDVTILGGSITVGGVDTRANRTAVGSAYAGAIVLKALQAPGYDTNSVLNVLGNTVTLSGAVRTDSGTYSRTGGNITLQGVVAQFDLGSSLATRSGATTNLSVGVTKTGYSENQLFINNSGSAYAATYSVQWTASANNAPHFTADPVILTNAVWGENYTATLVGAATDQDPGDTLCFSKILGPTWLQIAANGALSGTPSVSDIGTNAWRIAVSDGVQSDTAWLKIVVGGTHETSIVTGAEIRIMPMGDSITAGGSGGGYRLPLYNLLAGGGYNFDYVGMKAVAGDSTPDTNHWGMSGWQISDTREVIDGRSYVSLEGAPRQGLYDEMGEAISHVYFSTNSDVRNVILLMIGMNDFLHQVVDSAYGVSGGDVGMNAAGEAQDKIGDGCIARLQGLLGRIDTLAVDQGLHLDVLVATINQMSLGWAGDPVSPVITNEVVEYNQWIRSALPFVTYSNITVRVVELEGPLTGKLSDGVHPNTEGYATMAQVWYAGLTNNMQPPAQAVAFSAPTLAKCENAGSVTVNVKRIGSATGALSVRVSVCGGTATEHGDYEMVGGMLTWSDGDSAEKFCTINLLNDTERESDETILFTLTDASGVVIGTPDTTELAILDDDYAASPVTVSSAEVWDGIANPHATNGVTLHCGAGTEADPAVYTIPRGMTVTANGKITTSSANVTNSIKLLIRGGDLNMAAGGKLDISWAGRGVNSAAFRNVFTLDLDGTNSITGAGLITSGVTNGQAAAAQVHRALMITNVNSVTLSDVNLNVNYAATSYPRFQRPIYITASNMVTIIGKIDNNDLQALGDGASDVTIQAGSIEVNDVCATASRNGKPNGHITLKALAASGGYSTNSMLNQLKNRLLVSGTVRNDGVTGSEAGNVTLQAVVVQLNQGFQLAKQTSGALALDAGMAKAGYTESQLYLNTSGSSCSARHDVQWSAAASVKRDIKATFFIVR